MSPLASQATALLGALEAWEPNVPFVDAENFEERMKYTRAVARINSRVNLAVEWSEDGRSLRAEGFSVDVSAKGCLAIVPQGFAVGQKLRVVNLLNNKVSDATLIWRGHEGRQGWELGLELLNAPESFWGIEL
ncbi:MAG TPA: hypothetical protein VKF79_11340 [Candidatus Acidoferrum sp.]|nr:hypothetical protein [Candidatus Acidoferrum sp.]